MKYLLSILFITAASVSMAQDYDTTKFNEIVVFDTTILKYPHAAPAHTCNWELKGGSDKGFLIKCDVCGEEKIIRRKTFLKPKED